MKAVQVVARGRAEFVDVPRPEVAPGRLLVRPDVLALCGSDIHMLHFAAEDDYPFPPGTTGHEMVGRVVEVGPDVEGFAAGDRVLALSPEHQAMSELFLARVEHVVPVPDGLPSEQLVQAQQLGTVLYAAQRLPNLIGKNVAVVGQGSAGLWFNFVLRRLGARRVVALDIEPFRLELASGFGATDTVLVGDGAPAESLQGICGGELPHLVVEAAGEPAAINSAIKLVRPHGEILFFGLPRGLDFVFNYERYFRKCLRSTAIVGAATEADQLSTRIAIDWVARGIVDPTPLITHRVPFAEVLDAYEMHRRRTDGAVKIVIEMPH